jgi:alkylated DNA nucleotide flippase Atl1
VSGTLQSQIPSPATKVPDHRIVLAHNRASVKMASIQAKLQALSDEFTKLQQGPMPPAR